MDVLLLKLLLAPSLVVASTLAGRRWGSHIAGILVGLPIVAGPILFISYLQHGAGFASGAADASLLGLVSLALFATVFAHVGRGFGWFATLQVTWAIVLIADVVLSAVRLATFVGLLLTMVATLAATWLMPKEDERSNAPVQGWSRWDLPGRAAATSLLVLSVTMASSALGSRWTGLLAPFPIALSVVSAFGHAQGGPVRPQAF